LTTHSDPIKDTANVKQADIIVALGSRAVEELFRVVWGGVVVARRVDVGSSVV